MIRFSTIACITFGSLFALVWRSVLVLHIDIKDTTNDQMT